MSGWPQPQILVGADQARAQALVDELVSAVVPWSQQALDSRPLAEIALFLAVVSQRREVEVDFSDLIQRSIDAASEKPLTVSLHGLLNWSLTIEQTLQLLGGESDICETSDALLAESLEGVTPEADLEVDLVYGTAGCLAYLTQRPSTPLVERCRAGLLERFEAQVGQLLGQEQVELGYAHGLAGMIAVLADAVEGGWGRAREHEMLGRCVERLLNDRSPAGRYLFTYPAGLARIAWCNWDMGISFALIKGGRAVQQPAWVELGCSMAKQMAAVEPEASGISDACLCHGAAGAGLLLSLLGDQLKEPQVLMSARGWLNRVATYRSGAAPLAGFLYDLRGELGAPSWRRENVSILNGVSGLGLTLEGACGNVGAGGGWLKTCLFV